MYVVETLPYQLKFSFHKFTVHNNQKCIQMALLELLPTLKEKVMSQSLCLLKEQIVL